MFLVVIFTATSAGVIVPFNATILIATCTASESIITTINSASPPDPDHDRHKIPDGQNIVALSNSQLHTDRQHLHNP